MFPVSLAVRRAHLIYSVGFFNQLALIRPVFAGRRRIYQNDTE